MPLRDWIHNYPGVQKLLQQPGDVLDYTPRGADGLEPPAPPLVPPRLTPERLQQARALAAQAAARDRAARLAPMPRPYDGFDAFVLALLQTYRDFLERYGPASVWGYLAPAAFEDVLQEMARRDLHYQAIRREPDGLALVLYGIPLRPAQVLAAGTWLLHWSDQRTPRQETVAARVFRHLVAEAGPSPVRLVVEGPLLVSHHAVRDCEAVAPAPVCPCGGFLLRWTDENAPI